MRYAIGLIHRRIEKLLVTILWLVASAVAAQSVVPPPEITQAAPGAFSVSYTPCSACVGHGLEGFNAATGLWEFLGSQTLTIDQAGAGIYRFRTVYAALDSTGSYQLGYSAESTVTVNPNAAVEFSPSLPEQLAVDYRARHGDLDSDGVAELILHSGGGSRYLLLRQSGSGTLSATRPDANQIAASSAWQFADLEIVPRDVNIDGRADLVLRGIAAVPGFEQTPNQIVFGVGGEADSNLFEVRSMDSTLERFSRDINRHLVDPDYYPNNAPLTYGVYVSYTPYCNSWSYNGWVESSFVLPCIVYVNYYYVVYRDYSVYDWEAMRIASEDYAMIHGVETAANAMERIDIVLNRVLGVELGGWDIAELLGEEPDDDATRRGMELFSVIAGISEAAAQEPDGAAVPPDADRVLLKGRRVLGRGPYHTALEYQRSTVSAYDSDSRVLFDGLLVSQVNWPNDHPTLTLRHGYVDGPVAPSIYWARLLAADSRYDDDLAYDLFPSLGRGGFNSNSFVSGLIQATLGIPTVPMTRYVGGERPVPAAEFY